MRLFVMVGLMLAATATGANAEPDTSSANRLLAGCRAAVGDKDSAPPVELGTCVGVVMGVWMTAGVAGLACSPNGVTLGQVLRVVVQFIDARPARMHEQLTNLALEALISTWPCRKPHR
jgi:hypothetical protein